MRKKLNLDEVKIAVAEIFAKVQERIMQKGDSQFASKHEVYGIAAEEFKELMDALHANDSINFYEELIDIAVACVIGMASEIY